MHNERETMSAEANNNRIKALAKLLIAADDGDDDGIWSGIVSSKLKLFETKNENATASAATTASTGDELVTVGGAAKTPAAEPRLCDGEESAGEAAASEKRTEVDMAAGIPPVIRRHDDDLLRRPMPRSDDAKNFLCLVSMGCHDRLQTSHQSRALGWLASRGVPHVVVDGMDPDTRDFREELFRISGTRGNYPQFFVASSDGAIEYFGDFDKMERLNETSSLPPEILAMHPELETWKDITFGTTATAALAAGDGVDAVGAATAAASTETQASFDDCMAAETAVNTTTMTTTATGFPSSESPSVFCRYSDHKEGREEEWKRLKDGDAQERTMLAKNADDSQRNEGNVMGNYEGENGSHEDVKNNITQQLLQHPQSRLMFGCPHTFGAAGTGDVEYDYIPPVKERALAISLWEINKCNEESSNEINGHKRALEWQLCVSSSSSDADDGSGGGGVDGSSSGEELSSRQHGGVDGSTKVVNRKNEQPPTLLAHFLESPKDKEDNENKENGGPDDGRENGNEKEKSENNGKLKERAKKDVKRAVRHPPSLNFLAQFEQHENTVNGVHLPSLRAVASPPQSPSPMRRQALSPRNNDSSFFGSNVATAFSPSGSNKKISARNKPPLSPRIVDVNAPPPPSNSAATAKTSNMLGGGNISSPHGDRSSLDKCNNLLGRGIAMSQGGAWMMQSTPCPRSGSYFKQNDLVKNKKSISSSLSSPSAMLTRTAITSPLIVEEEDGKDSISSFDTNDFCHDFEEEEEDEEEEQTLATKEKAEKKKYIAKDNKSNNMDDDPEMKMPSAPAAAASCINGNRRFANTPQGRLHDGVSAAVGNGGGEEAEGEGTQLQKMATTATTPVIGENVDDIVEEAMEFLKTHDQGWLCREGFIVNDGEDLNCDIGHIKNNYYDENDENFEGDMLLAATRVALSLNRFLNRDDVNIGSSGICKIVKDGPTIASMKTTKGGQDSKHQHQEQKVISNDRNPSHESMIGKRGWESWIKTPTNDEREVSMYSKRDDNLLRFTHIIREEEHQPAMPYNNTTSKSMQPNQRISSSSTGEVAVRPKPKIKISIEGAPVLDFNKPEEDMFFIAAQPSPRYGDDTSLFSGGSTKKKKKNRMKLNPNGFFSNNNNSWALSLFGMTKKKEVFESLEGSDYMT
ncbi:hypothetical protein ACHAW5_000665 [Stephanodiscus triporus]|uniref:Glutaredoxin domain-containing protein n=1 Tax=Stephanodiscus triporus TaxID=2934178 RepID=A0ABD3PI83_9STRA